MYQLHSYISSYTYIDSINTYNSEQCLLSYNFQSRQGCKITNFIYRKFWMGNFLWFSTVIKILNKNVYSWKQFSIRYFHVLALRNPIEERILRFFLPSTRHWQSEAIVKAAVYISFWIRLSVVFSKFSLTVMHNILISLENFCIWLFFLCKLTPFQN